MLDLGEKAEALTKDWPARGAVGRAKRPLAVTRNGGSYKAECKNCNRAMAEATVRSGRPSSIEPGSGCSACGGEWEGHAVL